MVSSTAHKSRSRMLHLDHRITYRRPTSSVHYTGGSASTHELGRHTDVQSITDTYPTINTSDATSIRTQGSRSDPPVSPPLALHCGLHAAYPFCFFDLILASTLKITPPPHYSDLAQALCGEEGCREAGTLFSDITPVSLEKGACLVTSSQIGVP